MVLGLSKKDIPLPLRPEPPNTEQMLEDVQDAKGDDVVFTILDKHGEDSMSSSMLEESAYSCDVTSPAARSSTREGSQTNLESQDIETVYRQAVHFLEVNQQLIKAPDALKQQCEKLQESRRELAKAIEDLKKQSERVCSQTQ